MGNRGARIERTHWSLIPFDWRNPDYISVIAERVELLQKIRARPQILPALKLFYKNNPAQFINDFGCTFDPRNVERKLPATIPFLLFPRQVEWVEWLLERWRNQEPGITEKSREMGVTWLCVAVACTLCLFNPGMVIGFGSRKEEYIDRKGDPKSLFEKARLFLSNLPIELRGGWDIDKHAPFGRVLFPESGSAITGESGDGIGRGDRASLYIIDESAFLEHPELIDASLSQTTNCRIDVSTPNGYNNPFAIKRHSGKISVFTFRWQSDPRKGEDWYRKQVEILDPVTLASEVDIDYRGSVEGQLLPTAWINAAIGAAKKLGIEPTGERYASLDVADEGKDSNCFAARHGIELQYLKSWSGKDSDIYKTTVKAFALCDELGFTSLTYDGDGLGAGVRGDANNINNERDKAERPLIHVTAFRGSGQVFQPEKEMVPKRKNKDFFANMKAQSWWALRNRFEQTYRAVIKKMPVEMDAIISIDPNLAELEPLRSELSQVTYSINQTGKILIDKQPPGTLSPNRADSLMIAFNPQSRSLEVWAKLAD
jgi:phage terminase large subunit